MTRRERGLILFAITAWFAGVVLLWGLFLARGAVLHVFVSAILAIGFSPIVRWIERWRVPRTGYQRPTPRWLAILVLYVGILAIITGIVTLILPPLIAQARALWDQLPSYLRSSQLALRRRGFVNHIWTLDELLQQTSQQDGAVTGFLGAVQGVIGGVFGIVSVLLLTYYMLVEADRLRAAALRIVAEDRRRQASRIMRNVTTKVGAWLRGQLFLAVLIGMTTTVGLWLLGVPYFSVLAVIAALGELVPIVGPFVAAIPALLVASTVSLRTVLFVALYFAVQQFFEGNVLVPRIMHRQVGVSPVTVLVALLVGAALIGPVGALLAVPTAAIIQVFVQEFLKRDEG